MHVPLYLQVIDHYENPRNVGAMDKSDTSVGTGLVGAPACGDVMKLQVRPSSYAVTDNFHIENYNILSLIFQYN